MSTPQLVPNGFLSKVLQEFGMQWTHIAILSGIGFSSFGLDKYLHPGIWTLGTIAAFFIVYFFRRQLSNHFGRVAIFAIIGLAAAAVIPAVLVSWLSSVSVRQFLINNRELCTIYIALALVIPVAAMICSYKQQEDVFGGAYPNELRDAIRDNIAGGVLYRENQVYRLTVTACSDTEIHFQTELKYKLVNRGGTTYKWSGGFASSATSAEYLSAEVNGKQLDVKDRDYLRQSGFHIELDLPPEGSAELKFKANETFPQNSNELYTAYLPATSLRVEISNPPGLGAEITAGSLLPVKVPPSYEHNLTVYKAPSGVLPYQGFRLYWRYVPQPAVP